MKKLYHFSRKVRQLKTLSKRVTKSNFSNLSLQKQHLIILKLKRKYAQLKSFFSSVHLKKQIGLAAFAIAFQMNANAQSTIYAAPVVNEFNLLSSNWNNEAVYMRFADFDRDGDADLFATDINNLCDYKVSSSFYYLENVGTLSNPNFSLDTTMLSGGFMEYDKDVVLWDCDEDGDLDVMLTGENNGFCGGYSSGWASPSQHYIMNVGNAGGPEFNIINTYFGYGIMSFPDPLLGIKQRYFYEGEFADIDNNGDIDILGAVSYVTYYGYALGSYNVYVENINEDTSIFSLDKTCILSIEDQISPVENFVSCGNLVEENPSYLNNETAFSLVDINGDGFLDILNWRIDGDTLRIFEQLNTGFGP